MAEVLGHTRRNVVISIRHNRASHAPAGQAHRAHQIIQVIWAAALVGFMNCGPVTPIET
jgi:hypothetical protein